MGLLGANSGIGTWAMKSSPSMNKFVDMIQAPAQVCNVTVRMYMYVYIYISMTNIRHLFGDQISTSFGDLFVPATFSLEHHPSQEWHMEFIRIPKGMSY